MRVIDKKIKTLGELSKICDRLKQRGKRIVLCHGVFDLIHPGHIRHLASARKFGDVLVVTITKDRHVKRGPGRPIFNEHLRAETLASLVAVDYVASVDAPTAIEAIGAVRPDFYVKGPDYRDKKKDVTGKIYDEERAVRSGGGKIVFTDDVTFSSSSLINRHLEVYPPETVKYLKSLVRIYSIDDALERMARLKKMKVLVIGDAIIDQYHYCRPLAKSSKEPIVVHKYLSEESFAGGALATANHTAQICGSVDLVTVLGDTPSFEAFIRSRLAANIRPKLFCQKGAGTIIKRRFVNEDTPQKFFEVCYLRDGALSAAVEERIAAFLKKNAASYDAVIVNDFGHGMLTPRLIRLLAQKSRYLALNVQTNSANLGFNLVTKYDRADFVCIDEFEMRLASHDRTSNLAGLARKIHARMHCRQVAVTRGRDGALVYSDPAGYHSSPAFSYHIVDKVGAGDAFFAYTAPCFAAGFPQDLTSFIGNSVGSLAVQIVGNREPVRFADLVKFMTRLLKF